MSGLEGQAEHWLRPCWDVAATQAEAMVWLAEQLEAHLSVGLEAQALRRSSSASLFAGPRAAAHRGFRGGQPADSPHCLRPEERGSDVRPGQQTPKAPHNIYLRRDGQPPHMMEEFSCLHCRRFRVVFCVGTLGMRSTPL